MNTTLLRSLLFVPGNDDAKIRKASHLGADAIILDLEDAVPVDKKDEARRKVAELLPQLKKPRTAICVRVNPVSDPNLLRDLDEVVPNSPHGVILPKVESPEDVETVAKRLSLIEKTHKLKRESVRILALFETPRGILKAQTIASASRRLVGVCFGAIDFASNMGIRPSKRGNELLYARSHIALVARACGITAIDTVYPNYKDLSGLRREAELARRLGFDGKLVIHPAQVNVVNNIFSPSEQEVKSALETIALYEQAARREAGVATLGGRAIDLADYRQARKTLALASAIGLLPPARPGERRA